VESRSARSIDDAHRRVDARIHNAAVEANQLYRTQNGEWKEALAYLQQQVTQQHIEAQQQLVEQHKEVIQTCSIGTSSVARKCAEIERQVARGRIEIGSQRSGSASGDESDWSQIPSELGQSAATAYFRKGLPDKVDGGSTASSVGASLCQTCNTGTNAGLSPRKQRHCVVCFLERSKPVSTCASRVHPSDYKTLSPQMSMRTKSDH